MKKIVITGAGLAGLTTAYYLLKNSDDFDVTILEASDRVGGRVKTVEIDGAEIEVGGFMIFPWYKYFRKLTAEFGITDKIKPYKSYREFYKLSPDSGYVEDKNIKRHDFEEIKLVFPLLIPLLTGHLDFYEPDLELFEGQSTEDFIESRLGKGGHLLKTYRTIVSAYTYPGLEDMPVSISFGTFFNLELNGMFDRCQSIEGGTKVLIEKLEKGIKAKGGKIILNAKVTKIDKKQVMTKEKEYSADAIVLTHNLENSIYPQLLGSKIKFHYTQYYTAVVRMSKSITFKGYDDLYVAYNHPPQDELPHVSSFGKLQTGFKTPPEYMMINLNIHHNDKKEYSDSEIKQILVDKFKKIMPDNKIEELVYNQQWKKSIPSVGIDLLRKIKERQARDGFYFAGDYTGFPCMETAVYSGWKVAKLIGDGPS